MQKLLEPSRRKSISLSITQSSSTSLPFNLIVFARARDVIFGIWLIFLGWYYADILGTVWWYRALLLTTIGTVHNGYRMSSYHVRAVIVI